jgi:hypothetical protein
MRVPKIVQPVGDARASARVRSKARLKIDGAQYNVSTEGFSQRQLETSRGGSLSPTGRRVAHTAVPCEPYPCVTRAWMQHAPGRVGAAVALAHDYDGRRQLYSDHAHCDQRRSTC